MPQRARYYQAPTIFIGIFYVLLLAWTSICILLIGSMSANAGWPLALMLMVIFVMIYTWYFSLGISHKIGVSNGGDVELTSFRRVIRVNAEEIALVEGPRLIVIPYGFIRFRLEREKAYLFSCVTDEKLQQVLNTMRAANRHMRFKGL